MESGQEVYGWFMRSRWTRIFLPLVVLLLGIGLFIASRVLTSFREGFAHALVLYADKACGRLGVPADGKEALKGAVGRFREEYLSGKHPIQKPLDLIPAFDRGPLFEAMLISGFQNRFRSARGFDPFFLEWKNGTLSPASRSAFVEEVTEFKDINFSEVETFAFPQPVRFLRKTLGEGAVIGTQIETGSPPGELPASTPSSAPPAIYDACQERVEASPLPASSPFGELFDKIVREGIPPAH